jgi:hypothetical protein
MKLHPFYECVMQAKTLMTKGADVYQQFNCANCSTKQTMSKPNTFYKSGRCEECGYVTNIEANGCNFMAHFQVATTD